MTAPYEHTEACKASMEALAAYMARWPKACTSCGATGYWETMGTYADPPDGGLCSDCLEAGACPRCAEPVEGEPEVVCAACGWDSTTIEAAVLAAQRPPEGLVMPWHECECGWGPD